MKRLTGTLIAAALLITTPTVHAASHRATAPASESSAMFGGIESVRLLLAIAAIAGIIWLAVDEDEPESA